MLLLPIRTSIRPWRTPYVNYALIAVNVVIFFMEFQVNPDSAHLEIRPWIIVHLALVPDNPRWWQFVTYAFLHGDLWHIGFNMFFLYLFGNNVNDRLGHLGYLGFYLLGAGFSGAGHTVLHLSSQIPTLGASGAIAAVTGAYLVLFPQTLITVVYWFFFIGAIEVPALYFIALKLILIDNILARGPGSIAYDAHLAGYAGGVAAMLLLLATKILGGSNFDLWAMIKRWNRRRHYRDSVSSGYDPFTGRTAAKPIKVTEVKKTAAQKQQEERIAELRNEISSRIAERNLPAAADSYLELMRLDSGQIPPRQHLLDIANHLASSNRPAEAARAYEQFLTHYGSYEYAEQVELMLGLLYSRYLGQPEQAAKHLQAAAEKLTDPGQLKMCKDELARLKG